MWFKFIRKALITSLIVIVEISLYWILPSRSVKIHCIGWKFFSNVIVSIILISFTAAAGKRFVAESSGSSRLEAESSRSYG